MAHTVLPALDLREMKLGLFEGSECIFESNCLTEFSEAIRINFIAAL